MKMSILVLMPALACSCATLNESMTLGAGIGALAGGTATYAAKATSGGAEVSAGDVALGAGVGILGGLLTSYFTPVSYTHLRAHETVLDLVCRLLLEKKNTHTKQRALRLLHLPSIHPSVVENYD